MANTNLQLGGGLLPTPPDNRDFSYSLLFGQIDPVELPDEYLLPPLGIKDQGGTDMCVAFANTAAKEDQEGVILSPDWYFAKIKQIMGNWQSWGADLRTGCKAGVQYGFVTAEQAGGGTYVVKGRDYVANWENWDAKLDNLAGEYAAASYFKVDGAYDIFDNFRVALWQHRELKRSIVTGAVWRPQWNSAPKGIIPKEYAITRGTGHAFVVRGWVTLEGVPHLVVQNSYGTDYGDNGFNYMPREVVNREFLWGGYMFVDLPPNIARDELAKRRTLWWRFKQWLASLF